MSLLATREELQSEIASMKTLMENSGGAFVDLLNGNEPITFAVNNEIKQCPVNCILVMTSAGQGTVPSISGDGVTWTQVICNGGLSYPLKRGMFVKGSPAIMLLPCAKYDKSNWYYEYDGFSKLWLPPSTGRYHIVMAGGKSGNAYVHNDYIVTGSNTHFGIDGRQISFIINVSTIPTGGFALNIGGNSANAHNSGSVYDTWVDAASSAGGDTTFAGIVVNGGGGASAGIKFSGGSQVNIEYRGLDGITPSPGYDPSGIASGVSIEGDITSSTSDKGFVSISKLS